MLVEQLHDQSAALVQGSPQGREGDPVQLPQDVLGFCSWMDEEEEEEKERGSRVRKRKREE